jgi:hypothetical protein
MDAPRQAEPEESAVRYITPTPKQSEAPCLRFPKGGVWLLQQPASEHPRQVIRGRQEVPMPGDLTTEQVLDETQRSLDKLAADVNEIRGLLDDVLFRFPSRSSELDGSEWPPSAA